MFMSNGYEFVVAASRRSQPFSALCAEFGISRPTGYLWLRRYEAWASGDCRAQPQAARQSRRTNAAWSSA